MSAIGAALAKGLAALGGPAPAAAIIAGGLVVGVIGGGVIATGGGQGVTSEGELAVYACPGTGSPLMTIPGGQRLLATGRTEDSAWLRIHYPDPARTEAWVESGPLQATGSIAGLPVVPCAPEFLVTVPSFAPIPALAAVQDNSPTPAPSDEPVATPTPTPAIARNQRPDLSALTASERRIRFDTGDYCPNAPSSVTFRVRAEDDEGIASVGLFWREPGSGSFVRAAMNRSSGGARNGTWQATLDTVRNDITRNGSLAYYVVATDTDGATRRLPGNGSGSVAVERCVNEGPDISSVRSSGGSRLFEDPYGVDDCTTATTISAVVEDVDGVDSVQLFFRRPSDGGFQSRAMTLRGGRWSAVLDTRRDKIVINNPPSGTLRWYIEATDDTGLDTRIDTRLVDIRRCDTEADIGQSSAQLICRSNPSWVYGSADDPDGIGPQSAVLVYSYFLNDGTKRTARKRMNGNNDGRWYYSVQIQAGANWNLNRSPFTFYIETTDAYGGKTRGGAGETDVTSC